MVFKINEEECISCGQCADGCPNEAISEGDNAYVIDPAKCTECVGSDNDKPYCADVCPVEAPVKDPASKETQAELLAKYKKLHGK